MRSIFTATCLSLAMFSTGSVIAADTAKVATTEEATKLIQDKGYICLTCHQVDTKVLGPAYKEVAEKYKGADEATVARLMKQAKEGKAADLVWGQVPMPPNPTLTDEDAATIVHWILSLAAADAKGAEVKK
ncbi:c-type cytochrome [Beggiatoa leptomitoformis]|uniref:Cytochrome c-551 n=1 Tax=Beggiatoa leptomitoformis TaxID=288004 RepID=A0A2N9YHI0_9GAMM|nr:c-type cytochrome [Beggiatoa leptomitoformis]ALG68035.1 c-type cytochrome [Beggiatoa leptomitoformis]AUI69676.1 c-type cytochrome [Beggiatoa leptomitoformis]